MFFTFLAAFVSLIGLMVIHEFGHFILAKKFGADVEEFGIGYPPRIFGKKMGGVVYSLNLIPFGAFVSIKGEKGGIEDHHSFSGKPMWQRMLIVLGGVASFWIVAVILLSVVSWAWGLPTAVNDDMDGGLVSPKVKIVSLNAGSPAAQAGLELGDTVVGFDKIGDFQKYVADHQGEVISLTIQRGQDTLVKEVIPRFDFPAGEGPLGVGLARIALNPYPWYKAPFQGAAATAELTKNIMSGWVLGLKSLLGLTALPEGVTMDLMGPLGILNLLGEYFALGINYFLFLISIVAIALALANLLPIPALDGGKIIFLVIEFARGKAINSALEQRITAVFFVLLIIMMLFVTIKFDIPRLF